MMNFLSPATSRRGFMSIGGGIAAATTVGIVNAAAQDAQPTASLPATSPATCYRRINVGGIEIFYREAGRENAPVILLLHGFPTSSHMYRNLIPMLADRYRVIAPDYPAFGHSAVPPRSTFQYTHAHLSEVMDALLSKLGIARFAMYVMDFGGPIGYRLMLQHPDRVPGVIIQNAPIFGEPITGKFWATQLPYWKDPTPAHREAVAHSSLTPEAVRRQYLAGVRDPSLIDPDDWTLDSALLARPGIDEIMLDLLHDIKNNRQTVADARRFFGEHQNRAMIATGVNDPLFPGASMEPPADMPNIAFHPIDSGHFALEDHCAEIGNLSLRFLARVMPA